MDFSLSEENNMLLDSIREFAKEQLAASVEQAEQPATISANVLEKIAELGYCGVSTDAALGGAGFDNVGLAIVVKEIAHVDPAMAARVAFTAGPVQTALTEYGSDEQKQTILADLAAGKKWGTVALFEPSKNGTPEVLLTTAEKSGNDWILNGEKSFVINAPDADVYIVFAQTGDQWTAFLLTENQAGMEFSIVDSTLGTDTLSISHIKFSECHVTDSQRLGNIGDGSVFQPFFSNHLIELFNYFLFPIIGVFTSGHHYLLKIDQDTC